MSKRPLPARTLSALVAVALTTLGGCSRKQPSDDYARAAAIHSRLYAEKLDDAYLDPQMAEAEALLKRVPPDSLDTAAARQLLLRIQQSRARLTAERTAREQAVASAVRPPPDPLLVAPEEAARLSPDGGPAQQPDAGSPQPIPGMSRAELVQRFSGCFRQAETVVVETMGPRETWELKDIANCQDRHPDFVGLILIMDDKGAIWRFAPRSALERRVVDGGTPAPAGGPTEGEDAGTP